MIRWLRRLFYKRSLRRLADREYASMPIGTLTTCFDCGSQMVWNPGSFCRICGAPMVVRV